MGRLSCHWFGRRLAKSKLLPSLLWVAGILVLTRPLVFVTGPLPDPRGRPATPLEARALPWEFGVGGGSAKADAAYAVLATEFPKLAEKSGKGVVTQRFESLSQLLDQDTAFEMIEKEPIVLMWDSDNIKGTWDFLKALETSEDTGKAKEIVLQNPKVLTVSASELARTGSSLQSLGVAAAGIDAVRPLGPFGPFIVTCIFFLLFILVLRPIFYGFNGGPSLLSVALSPFSGVIDVLSQPYKFLLSNGINPVGVLIWIGFSRIALKFLEQASNGKFKSPLG